MKMYLVSLLVTFFSVGENESSQNDKITVVGTAVVMMHIAVVRTDDNLLYYLHKVDDWDDKYLGKRVKVTGKLIFKDYRLKENIDSLPILPQQRLGIWRIIKRPKWSLVE